MEGINKTLKWIDSIKCICGTYLDRVSFPDCLPPITLLVPLVESFKESSYNKTLTLFCYLLLFPRYLLKFCLRRTVKASHHWTQRRHYKDVTYRQVEVSIQGELEDKTRENPKKRNKMDVVELFYRMKKDFSEQKDKKDVGREGLVTKLSVKRYKTSVSHRG